MSFSHDHSESKGFSGAPNRRNVLAGLSFSACGMLAGCAAPKPAAEPFDPRSLVYPPPPETPRFYYDRMIRGSTDVIEETSQDRLRRFATGESIRGRGFAKPFGVAAFEGRVFVTDTVARYTHVYDFPGKRYYTIGSRGVGRQSKPFGVAIDQGGRVYVVDGTAARVLVYDFDGRYITAIGQDDNLARPTGVAVSPAGDRIYVLETGGVNTRRHQVTVFSADGAKIGVIGGRGSTNGRFNLPLDIATGPNGQIYVLDTGNFRVQIFSENGDFIRTFGEAGRFPGQFGHPKGISVDGEGKVFISDTSFGLFQIFNNEDRILMSVGERSERSGGPGRFLLPAGISVDIDTRIYVVDQFYQKVEVFRAAATPDDWPMGQMV